MQNYYVTTDQTADFPKELQCYNFKIIPMTYCIDGILYDGVENEYLSSAEFYRLLSEGKNSTTSMVSVDFAENFFAEILKEGYDILHISFSSALSGCFDSYVQAAQNLKQKFPERKICVIDSKCASGGEGLLCHYALKKRDEDADLLKNVAYINDLRDHIGHEFTVNDMYHLYRGGRVSRGAAVIGSAIKIKPVLTVNEKGELVPISKVIGRKIALRALVDRMVLKGEGYNNDVIIISHGDCEEDAVALKQEVLAKLGENQKVIIGEIGAVIGSHCGKGVLALFYLAKDKQI